MWACFCWLQKYWVCHLTLNTMPSSPRLVPMPHSTIGLIAESVECSPLHPWKASHGGHLHFKEMTFSKSVNTFDSNNHMWCLFLIWWHLIILKWTGVTLGTLTMRIIDIEPWLIIRCLGLMIVLLHLRRQMGLSPVIFSLNVYQTWDEVIWLTPEKECLMSVPSYAGNK